MPMVVLTAAMITLQQVKNGDLWFSNTRDYDDVTNCNFGDDIYGKNCHISPNITDCQFSDIFRFVDI